MKQNKTQQQQRNYNQCNQYNEPIYKFELDIPLFSYISERKVILIDLHLSYILKIILIRLNVNSRYLIVLIVILTKDSKYNYNIKDTTE